MRSHLNEALRTNLEDIDARYRAGRISRDVGLAATRRVIEMAVEEATAEGNMEEYIALRNSGRFDAARSAAGGWRDDQSQEASARERADALAAVVAQRADEMLQAGQMSPEAYGFALEKVDPGSIDAARVHMKVNQAVPGDLDERPRDLDASETAALAGVAYYRRQGMIKDEPQQSNPDSAPEPSASDWSSSRLEQFFDSREPKEGTD